MNTKTIITVIECHSQRAIKTKTTEGREITEYRPMWHTFASVKDAKEFLLAGKDLFDAPQWADHYSIGDDEVLWLTKDEVDKYRGARDSFKLNDVGEGLFRVYTDKDGERWATLLCRLIEKDITILGSKDNLTITEA
jgi:hypothetical protein